MPFARGQYVDTPRGIGVLVLSEPHDLWHQIMRAQVVAAPLSGCTSFPIHGTPLYLCFDLITVQGPDVTAVGEGDAELVDLRASVLIAAKLWRENRDPSSEKDLTAAVDTLYERLTPPAEVQPVT